MLRSRKFDSLSVEEQLEAASKVFEYVLADNAVQESTEEEGGRVCKKHGNCCTKRCGVANICPNTTPPPIYCNPALLNNWCKKSPCEVDTEVVLAAPQVIDLTLPVVLKLASRSLGFYAVNCNCPKANIFNRLVKSLGQYQYECSPLKSFMECHAETWTYTLAVLLVLTPKCIRNKALARARLLIKRCVERKCDKELSAPPLVTDEDTSDTLAAKGWDQKCFAEQHPLRGYPLYPLGKFTGKQTVRVSGMKLRWCVVYRQPSYYCALRDLKRLYYLNVNKGTDAGNTSAKSIAQTIAVLTGNTAKNWDVQDTSVPTAPAGASVAPVSTGITAAPVSNASKTAEVAKADASSSSQLLTGCTQLYSGCMGHLGMGNVVIDTSAGECNDACGIKTCGCECAKGTTATATTTEKKGEATASAATAAPKAPDAKDDASKDERKDEKEDDSAARKRAWYAPHTWFSNGDDSAVEEQKQAESTTGIIPAAEQQQQASQQQQQQQANQQQQQQKNDGARLAAESAFDSFFELSE